jgi:hypothetical protein
MVEAEYGGGWGGGLGFEILIERLSFTLRGFIKIEITGVCVVWEVDENA